MTISQFLRATGFLSLLTLLTWWAWNYGKQASTNGGHAERRFQVAGPSMVPTLYGPSIQTKCVNCKHSTRLDPRSTSYPAHQNCCILCGSQFDFTNASPTDTLPGDVVKVNAIQAPLRIGDIVAINVDGQLRAKRIAALSGDVVAADQQRITINGKRLDDTIATRDALQLPKLIVDDDRLREKSRWSPAKSDSSWRRNDWQWTHGPEVPDGDASKLDNWLVYHHANVRKNGRPGPILDDCQFNTGVVRTLNKADRLIVMVRLLKPPKDLPAVIKVAFWVDGKVRVASKEIRNQEPCFVSYYESEALAARPAISPPSLSETQPIAIATAVQKIAMSDLQILRHVSYRTYSNQQTGYPITIANGQCFVIGDNEFVSVDSRKLGPLPIKDIVGIVTLSNMKLPGK